MPKPQRSLGLRQRSSKASCKASLKQYKTPTTKDAYERGFERGFNCASWQDLPEIGWKIPRHIDYVGYSVVDEENQGDVWEMMCFESESGARDFSPFEFTAHDLNEIADSKPYDVWEVFDNGITAGIRSYWRKHYASR